MTFSELLNRALQSPKKKIAVALAEDSDTLQAVKSAFDKNIAEPILVGNKENILQIAKSENISIDNLQIVDESDPDSATYRAVELVGKGEADLLMKGKVDTTKLMKCALDEKAGFRTGRLLSHITLMEIKGFERMIAITDAGLVPTPTLEQKIQIAQNAIDFMNKLGISNPKVAALSSSEIIEPKVPSSVEASELAKACKEGKITGGIVDGPLGLDNALVPQAAKAKGIKSEVAGCADVLLVPDVVSGNLLSKAMFIFSFGKAKAGGVIIGGKSPIILISRAADSETKFNSIMLGVLTA